MKNFMLWDGEKTNPIQSQTKPNSFSPQILWGLKNLFEKTKPICHPSAGNPKFEFRNPKQAEWVPFEKTKPICRRAKLAQTLIWKEIMVINQSEGHEKTKPNKANLLAFSVLWSRFALDCSGGLLHYNLLLMASSWSFFTFTPKSWAILMCFQDRPNLFNW